MHACANELGRMPKPRVASQVWGVADDNTELLCVHACACVNMRTCRCTGGCRLDKLGTAGEADGAPSLLAEAQQAELGVTLSEVHARARTHTHKRACTHARDRVASLSMWLQAGGRTHRVYGVETR